MKKIILLLGVIFIGIISMNAQNEFKNVSIGWTNNSFNGEFYESDDMAMVIAVNYNWFHFDYSNSLKEVPSTSDIKNKNPYWHGGNIGVNFNITPKKNDDYIYITPKIGYITREVIEEESITNINTKLNIGIDFTFVSKGGGISLGFGTTQKIYCTFGIPF